MIPVILSGGSGTRLWPLSRELYPKQFLPLHSERTLLQETVSRLKEVNLSDPIVVCNEEHRFIVADNLCKIKCSAKNIILEPIAKNTAPAIAAASMIAMQGGDDPVLMILPADHIIEDLSAFASAVKLAKDMAEKNHLVTFGIKPTEAHTGYGYIELGDKLVDGVNEISAFKEKPDVKTAESFLESGRYLWNGGMFCFKASVYIEELKKYCPDMIPHVENAVSQVKSDLDFERLERNSFEKCESIAIDYAVMEQTDKGVVVGLDAGWSDIGSWDSVWELSKKDAQGNVSKGDILCENSKNSYIFSNNKMVCALGVEDLIIIDTKDALLVSHRDEVQNIKSVVSRLKENNRSEAKCHKTIYRPWGNYTIISQGQRHQTKRITVHAGAKLSLQKHHHRSEHWIIVKGTAKVTKNEEEFVLTENESVYIPIGTIHALENPGKIPLELIEVQTGSYLDEDDIVRYEDKYGRV